MSNSDQEDIGYGKPPRKHQFSKDNQPRRRRSKVPKGLGHNLLANILQAMGDDVSITLNGKPTKAKAAYVFARRLVKQSVGGTLNEQIKFANFLRDYGELDPDSIREAVEEEHKQALEEEQSKNAELLSYFAETMALIQGCRLSFRVIADGFLGAGSKCSCGSFDDYAEAAKAIGEWYQDDDSEEPGGDAEESHSARNPGWAPSAHNGFKSESPAHDDAMGSETDPDGPIKIQKGGGIAAGPRGGDLTEGMIGND